MDWVFSWSSTFYPKIVLCAPLPGNQQKRSKESHGLILIISVSTFDSRDFKSMKSFIGEVIERFGRIDGLVNNAAIGQDHLLVHMSNEIAKEIIEVNLLAPVMITKEVVKQMMLQGGGRIVTISSICGSRGYPGLAVYSATKGALDSFSRSLLGNWEKDQSH